MKALIYTAAKTIELCDQPPPIPAVGEVMVAIDAVGICGSDLHAYLGFDERRVPPLILGHEACGTVTSGKMAGRRVVLNPLITCGHCDDCVCGRTNLCSQRDMIGMYRAGAFAQQIAIPERQLIPIPDGMAPAHAALTEPAATAVHAVNLAQNATHRPLSEGNALVIGGGSVGLFAAFALAEQGVRHIDLAETNPLRAAKIRQCGICATLDPQQQPVNKGAYDVVIDAVGGGSTRAMACAAAKPGGLIVHIGLQNNDGGLDARRLTLQEITFIGTYTYTMVDMRSTVRKLHQRVFGDLSWLETRPLDNGPSAFDDLLHGRTCAPKIVLHP